MRFLIFIKKSAYLIQKFQTKKNILKNCKRFFGNMIPKALKSFLKSWRKTFSLKAITLKTGRRLLDGLSREKILKRFCLDFTTAETTEIIQMSAKIISRVMLTNTRSLLCSCFFQCSDAAAI